MFWKEFRDKKELFHCNGLHTISYRSWQDLNLRRQIPTDIKSGVVTTRYLNVQNFQFLTFE